MSKLPERELSALSCGYQLSDSTDQVVLGTAGVVAYVCRHCDNTHFAIACDDMGLWLTLSLTPAQAEIVAAQLQSPIPDPFAPNH